MKVIRQTPNLLVIEQKPTQSTIAVLGITSACIPLFFIWYSISHQGETHWFVATFCIALSMCPAIGTIRQLTVSTCKIDKNLQTLTLKRKNLLGEKLFKHSFNDIKDVRLKVIGAENGDRYEIRIELVKGSYLALNEWMAADDKCSAEEITSLLQSFLNGRQRSSY
jgi:hypothetical protein